MRRFAPGVVLLFAASLVLVGCVPSITEGASGPSPTTAVTSTPSDTPSAATATTVTFPAQCDELISSDELGSIVGLTVREVPWNDVEQPPDSQPGDDLPGPLAQEAARGAAERLDCMWWPEPAIGWNFSLHVMRIDDGARSALVNALRSDSEYTEDEIMRHPVFAHSYENGLGAMSSSYAFIQDIWIAVATATPADALHSAMARIVEDLG